MMPPSALTGRWPNPRSRAKTPKLRSWPILRLSACRFNPDDPTKILPLQGDNDRKIVQGFINYISTHTPEEIAEAAPLA